MRRILGFVRFLILFSGEFIKANLEVARLVLFVPKNKLTSGFVDYSIEELTFNEALLISQCITLTPGTITALFDWENRRIRIHVLDFSDPLIVKKNIDHKLKQAILRFSR